MKRIIIIGATSGIGRQVALLFLQKGYQLGIAGRRLEALQQLQAQYPDLVEIEPLDIRQETACKSLNRLIEKVGGMDIFFLCSGIGKQNLELQPEIEINTAKTNVEGFTRMVVFSFNYFKKKGNGQIAVISSIAGTKGLGVAPAYSATKRFQNTYIDSLAQLAYIEKLNIQFTDIRPGFVDTDLLKGDKHYPLLMKPNKVASIIIDAIEKKKRKVIIDWRYAILVFFWKLIPEWLWERLPIQN